MLAGASLVAVGTASFRDPYAAVRVAGELDAYCMRQGVNAVHELTGAVQPW